MVFGPQMVWEPNLQNASTRLSQSFEMMTLLEIFSLPLKKKSQEKYSPSTVEMYRKKISSLRKTQDALSPYAALFWIL